MYKKRKNLKLGVHKAHTNAILKGLVISLVKYEQIETTKPRSRALKATIDRLISRAKRGGDSVERYIYDFVRDEATTKKIMNKLAPRFKDRNSGFVSIYRLLNQAGNNGEVYKVAFMGYEVKEKRSKKKADKKDKAAPVKKEKAEKTPKKEEKKSKK